jgi:hypothetical protein
MPFRSTSHLLPVLALVLAGIAGACAAVPPPIAVGTPYGVVHAESRHKATEVAELLVDLCPRVRATLPGTIDRPIDVWVQRVLRDDANGARGAGVKGFTLLSGEFRAKRIHLLEDGELSWYLSHELVHASLDSSWHTLPGLLEEGLGDVVAEALNREHAERIRAHRLFTSSSFFQGVIFQLAYQRLEDRAWVESPVRLEVLGEGTDIDVTELVGLSRHDLRKRFREVPEPFYGLAYLIVSRIVERRGFDGLHELCTRAHAAGLDVVPPKHLLAAAELDPARFTPEQLASFFGRDETRQLLMMQPDIFADTIAAYFRANLIEDVSARTLLYRLNPSLRTADGSLVSLRRVWPVRQKLAERWNEYTLALR